MQVKFTNNASSPLLVQSLYVTIPVGGFVTTRRSWSDLDRDLQLKKLVQAGSLGLTFVKESGDDASLIPSSSLPSYTTALRPAATDVPALTAIWNTTTNMPNWSDGTAWRDSEGALV
jgi:hypothetical protein